MPKFVEVCRVEDVPTETGLHVIGPNGKPMALFRVEETLYAVNALCPHMGGPLQSGKLTGNVVSCPWHQWSYCVDTGLADHEGGHRIATYEVQVEDGVVRVGWLKNPG